MGWLRPLSRLGATLVLVGGCSRDTIRPPLDDDARAVLLAVEREERVRVFAMNRCGVVLRDGTIEENTIGADIGATGRFDSRRFDRVLYRDNVASFCLACETEHPHCSP